MGESLISMFKMLPLTLDLPILLCLFGTRGSLVGSFGLHHDDKGKLCIEVKSTDKIAFISEVLCIGCGICVKK